MDSDYSKLIEAIGEFCRTVERFERYQCLPWLRKIERLLRVIDDGMARLNLETESGFFVLPDLDHRFQLYCRLKAFLGDLDGYPLAGDKVDDPEDHSGSLADDITDLYFELRRGLQLYQVESATPLPALSLWQTGYRLHWQDHLLGARSRLQALLH